MNHDEQKSGLIPLLFPCIYFGLAAFYFLFDVFVLGNYEPKDGQWGSFKISLAILGFMTLLASGSYCIGQACLKTALQRLSHSRLALITVLSALLSVAVMLALIIVEADTAPMLFWFGGVCLCPALIGVSLVKIHQRWYAAHPSA